MLPFAQGIKIKEATTVLEIQIPLLLKVTPREPQIFHLHSLDVSASQNVDDAWLAALFSASLPARLHLRILCISRCRLVTDTGLAQLVHTSITTLDIGLLPRVTDAGFAYLAGLARRGGELRMRGLLAITDAGLAHLQQRAVVACVTHGPRENRRAES